MNRLRTPRFIATPAGSAAQEQAEIEAGLLGVPARVSPKYFYDRLGSFLFDAITELPEYYPTRTEAAIVRRHGTDIAAHVPPAATLVDLGAGNCEKAERWFALLEPRRYVAVDISAAFLHDALKRLQREHPALDIVGIGQDFSRALVLPEAVVEGGPLVYLYPGSSIGNLAPEQALVFLQGLRAQAPGAGLLIGVDLVKPQAVLEAAYDDALGVTAAFNLNVLRQVNRLLGADFAPADWRHVGLYNADQSRVEMHLEARREVAVRWPGGRRDFAAGERIHTENSCKYTLAGFAELLARAGFTASAHWTDERQWFAVFWATSV